MPSVVEVPDRASGDQAESDRHRPRHAAWDERDHQGAGRSDHRDHQQEPTPPREHAVERAEIDRRFEGEPREQHDLRAGPQERRALGALDDLGVEEAEDRRFRPEIEPEEGEGDPEMNREGVDASHGGIGPRRRRGWNPNRAARGDRRTEGAGAAEGRSEAPRSAGTDRTDGPVVSPPVPVGILDRPPGQPASGERSPIR